MYKSWMQCSYSCFSFLSLNLQKNQVLKSFIFDKYLYMEERHFFSEIDFLNTMSINGLQTIANTFKINLFSTFSQFEKGCSS